MDRLEMLQVLSEKVSKCTACPDLVTNRTQTVIHSGNPDSQILFLGEGPGADEDEQGEVFVGSAGQLLMNIMKACGLSRENTYLCNIVKCRPPKNRTPTIKECNNCEPYLKLQIKIINPKFIVCLGNTAAQNLLKVATPISYLRGKWFNYTDGNVNAEVLCTYHPSYALRSGEKVKKEIYDDLQLLLDKLQQINETC